MRNIIWGVVLGGLFVAQPALAQGPRKGEGRGVEAELDKLRNRIQELEARLEKGPGGRGGFEGKGPPFGKKEFGMKKEGKEGGKGPWSEKKDAKGWGGWEQMQGKGPPPFAKKKDGKGPWGEGWAKMAGKGPPFAKWTGGGEPDMRRGAPAGGDLERRLDRILRDLEDLREDMRRESRRR